MRTRVVIVLAALIIQSSVLAAAGPKISREPLTVRIYTSVSLNRRDVEIARRIVESVMGGAHIDIRWRDCPVSRPIGREEDPCDDELGAFEVILRIAPSTATTVVDVLGESVIDLRTQRSVFATAFADRVQWVATRTGADPAIVLGWTMAHELGHLLLGSPAHAARGLMRATWTADELRTNAPTTWILSRQEKASMRRGLQARRDGGVLAASTASAVQAQ